MTQLILSKEFMAKKLLLKQKLLLILLHQEEGENQEEEPLPELGQIFPPLMMKVQVKSADNVCMKEMDLNVHLLNFMFNVILAQNLWLTETILHYINIVSYVQQISVTYTFHHARDQVSSLI